MRQKGGHMISLSLHKVRQNVGLERTNDLWVIEFNSP